jgi:hypothetical protein
MPPKSIPAVMFIEMGLDSMRAEDPVFMEREAKELASLGEMDKQKLIAQCGGDALTAGYLLGLETARAILITMPVAIQANVYI